MRISFCILTSAALAGIASAWTTPTSADTGNSFYTPGLNQIVPVGAPFNVTWNVSLLSYRFAKEPFPPFKLL